MSDTYATLRQGQRAAERAAELLRGIRAARGDADGLLDGEIALQEAAAVALRERATDVRPSGVLANWGRGQAAAMVNYHPRAKAPRG